MRKTVQTSACSRSINLSPKISQHVSVEPREDYKKSNNFRIMMKEMREKLVKSKNVEYKWKG